MSWTNARSQKFLFALTILFFALVLAHIFFPFGYEGRYKLNSQEVRDTFFTWPTLWAESIDGIELCVSVRHHFEDDHYLTRMHDRPL